MDPAITVALNLLFEAFKAIQKDDLEKFMEEWKKDEQAFLKALAEHNSAELARLISKYSNVL